MTVTAQTTAATPFRVDLAALRAEGHDLTRLPFADRAFAHVQCLGLDEVDDPLAVARELQRIARTGTVILPPRSAVWLGCALPACQWLASTTDGVLVLQRRPFVRHPLGHPHTPEPAALQLYWEDVVPIEVHDDGGYRADDAEQYAFACLDFAEAGLRDQVGDLPELLAAADAAVQRLPQWARAHHVRGQCLWWLDRRAEAAAAARVALALAPQDAVLARANAAAHRAPSPLPVPPQHPLDAAFWAMCAHDGGIDVSALLAPIRPRLPRLPGDPTVSRFVRRDDPALRHFVFALPKVWWSRGHEYAWAMQFAAAEHTVLDAASGIGHPLKFALAQRCRATFACDLDARITDDAAILADIQPEHDGEAARELARQWLPRIDRRQASITATPYANASFDRVFCISVLEHLPPADRLATLREFARIVRPGGRIVLTMDHPLVDLDEFVRCVAAAGLRFVGEVRQQVPPDALWSPQYGLRCFRALLAPA